MKSRSVPRPPLARAPMSLALALVLAGCESSTPGDLADGGARSDGGSSDAGPEADTALLDRTPDLRYSCAASPVTRHAPRVWMRPLSLVGTSSTAFLFARAEGGRGPGGFDFTTPRLALSTMTGEGALGEPILPAGERGPIGALDAVAVDGGAALVWEESGSLFFARHAASGEAITARRALPSLAAETHGLIRLVRAGDGFAVLDASRGSLDALERLRFLRLDASGAELGAPLEIYAGSAEVFSIAASIIEADGGGFAVVFVEGSGQASSIRLVNLDASGARVGEPKTLSEPNGTGFAVGRSQTFEPSRIAIARAGDGYAIAWPEDYGEGDITSQRAYAVVRIARFDRDGNALTPRYVVRKPEFDVDEVEPALLPFGDSLALMWAHGSRIYICGGCVPDHRIEAVLLDPADLSPRSNVVSIAPTGQGGYLWGRTTAVSGSMISTAFAITFHVSSDPASVGIRCE